MKRPMLYAATALIVISIFSYYLDETVLIIPIGLIFISLAILIFKSIYHIVTIATLIIIFTFCVFSEMSTIKSMDMFSNKRMTLNLVATEQPQNYGSVFLVTVRDVDKTKFAGDEKLLLMYSDDLDINAGDVFSATVTAHSLKESQYKMSNYADSIYSQLELEKFENKIGVDSYYSNLQDIRTYISDTIDSSMSSESAATMRGMVLGDKSCFSAEFSDNVRASGVSHVMVVSGLHLTIILGGFFTILEMIFYNRYVKLFLSVISVLALVAICGFTVSAIRAGLMFVIAALASVMNRDGDSLSCLSFSLIIILISSPFSIFSVSLQLSMLATFGIIAIAPFYVEIGCQIKIFAKYKFLSAALKIIINTLSATVTTLPVLVHNFGCVSIVSPITNVLITYAITLSLSFCCIAVFLSLVPLLEYISYLIFYIVDIIASFINACINYFGSLGFATVDIDNSFSFLAITPTILLLAIIYACKRNGYLLKSNKVIKKEGALCR